MTALVIIVTGAADSGMTSASLTAQAFDCTPSELAGQFHPKS
jgi:hypothetical protein